MYQGVSTPLARSRTSIESVVSRTPALCQEPLSKPTLHLHIPPDTPSAGEPESDPRLRRAFDQQNHQPELRLPVSRRPPRQERRKYNSAPQRPDGQDFDW